VSDYDDDDDDDIIIMNCIIWMTKQDFIIKAINVGVCMCFVCVCICVEIHFTTEEKFRRRRKV